MSKIEQFRNNDQMSCQADVIIITLDYCNSVLAGLPCLPVASLQRVQNTTAPLVMSLSSPDHVRLALVELHWQGRN